MFILSQDKKKFADYKKVYVSPAFSRKNNIKKAFLLGVPVGLFGGFVEHTLGSYESEEAAIMELENICADMKNGETAYTVK